MIDMFSIYPKKQKSISVIYWVLYLVFFTVMQPGREFNYLTSFYIELISLPPKIIFVTVVLRFLMERFLFKRRVRDFTLLYIILMLGFVLIQRLIDIYIYAGYFVELPQGDTLLTYQHLLYSIIKLQFVATIPMTINLFEHWGAEQRKAHAVKEAHSQAELNFLRNQFHPHFIFNALNSLYSKILNKSDESADIVLKISALLRFSIYDANTEKVSLKKEIGYLKDYIALQKIRFDQNLDLSISIDGCTDNKIIAPFIIMPFIENSFKYCLGTNATSGWITISISVKEEWLTVKIENSMDSTIIFNEQEEGNKSRGIGLSNVRRRLQILYPNRHTLKITDTEESFFVILKLMLEQNEDEY